MGGDVPNNPSLRKKRRGATPWRTKTNDRSYPPETRDEVQNRRGVHRGAHCVHNHLALRRCFSVPAPDGSSTQHLRVRPSAAAPEARKTPSREETQTNNNIKQLTTNQQVQTIINNHNKQDGGAAPHARGRGEASAELRAPLAPRAAGGPPVCGGYIYNVLFFRIILLLLFLVLLLLSLSSIVFLSLTGGSASLPNLPPLRPPGATRHAADGPGTLLPEHVAQDERFMSIVT